MSREKERLSVAVLRTIRRQYSEPILPPCQVCGEPMSQHSNSGNETTYACSTIDVRKPDWESHFHQSRITHFGKRDSRIIQLLDDYEKLRDLVRNHQESLDELGHPVASIAEALEERVDLPKCYEFEMTLEYTGEGEFELMCQESLDPLCEAGLNDCLIGMRNGRMRILCDREHDSLELAIQSVMEDVERANLGLKATLYEGEG